MTAYHAEIENLPQTTINVRILFVKISLCPIGFHNKGV